ncbi:MAG: tetraacyldisaccharide 4'-kinase [candidate division Zixibacteria bacterium]|nr:tetraacyldisaccharide 4'-kinase [candidate division Zixibacteria bacterium]
MIILSRLYYFVIRIRKFFYGIGIFKRYKLNAKVISVGNITWGGTGKTSFVSFLVKELTERNQKIAILIRGYKRKEKKMITITSNTKDLDWRKVGDEACLLATQLDSIPIIVSKNRVKSGKEAIDKYSPDFLILDDGFQHLKLMRDLDIVMIDASDPFGNGKLLPAGKLREPIGNIKRADILVLNRADKAYNNKMGLINKLREYNSIAPVIETKYMVEKIYNLENEGKIILPSQVKDKKILGFCGIGNAQSFKQTLEDLGVNLLKFIVFPDHYAYKDKDIKEIEREALNRKANFVLTTEKDKIRLISLPNSKVPIYIVKIKLEIISGETSLWNLIYGE